MADLITLARAKYNLAKDTAFTSAEDDTINALIDAITKAIHRFCKRTFDSNSYDELYRGDGQEKLILRNFPIISVARVAHNPTTVLEVTNTSSSNQRATVSVTSTGLTLVRVASGTVTTDSTITFAGNATIEDLKDAIGALGNGWSASIPSSDFNDLASADLRAIQGALNAKDVQAPLKLHIDELSDYEVDTDRGWLLRSCEWFGGPNYWRVLYTAGYSTVPEDIQEACAEWVAHLYFRASQNPSYQAESSAPSGGTASSIAFYPLNHMPGHVRELLLPYRKYRV
jgi:hypothetical protein